MNKTRAMFRLLTLLAVLTNLLLATPINKREIKPCHKDHDCAKNECCAVSFGVRECSQIPGYGEPCTPANRNTDQFSSCSCHNDHVCLPGSLFAFVDGMCL